MVTYAHGPGIKSWTYFGDGVHYFAHYGTEEVLHEMI